MTIYSDLNTNNPTVSPYVTDAEAVFQHITTILSTNKGERLFRPDLGISMRNILFELMDDVTEYEIRQELLAAITEQDYRVQMDYDLTGVTPIPDEKVLEVVLAFSILGLVEGTFEFVGTLEI